MSAKLSSLKKTWTRGEKSANGNAFDLLELPPRHLPRRRRQHARVALTHAAARQRWRALRGYGLLCFHNYGEKPPHAQLPPRRDTRVRPRTAMPSGGDPLRSTSSLMSEATAALDSGAAAEAAWAGAPSAAARASDEARVEEKRLCSQCECKETHHPEARNRGRRTQQAIHRYTALFVVQGRACGATRVARWWSCVVPRTCSSTAPLDKLTANDDKQSHTNSWKYDGVVTAQRSWGSRGSD